MENIYRQLQRKLNTIGAGVPESPKDNDIKYLEELYTPEEAAFALDLPKGLHTAAEFAELMGRPVGEVEPMLKTMAKDGLVYKIKEDGVEKYYLVPSYQGLIEFNVGRLNPKIAKAQGIHFAEGLGARIFGSETPLFRFFPVRPNIVEDGKCLDVDNRELILKNARKIVLCECFCRASAEMAAGKPVCKCNPAEKGNEVCMVVNDLADFYLENGTGREISYEEAMKIVDKCVDAGCVCTALSTTDVEIVCNCCSDCCGGVMAFGVFGGKGAKSATNYKIEFDASKCVKCGACVKCCPTRANKIVDDQITLREKKCIGCGQCVLHCEHGARKLVIKPEEELFFPVDKDMPRLYEKLSAERKKSLEF